MSVPGALRVAAASPRVRCQIDGPPGQVCTFTSVSHHRGHLAGTCHWSDFVKHRSGGQFLLCRIWSVLEGHLTIQLEQSHGCALGVSVSGCRLDGGGEGVLRDLAGSCSEEWCECCKHLGTGLVSLSPALSTVCATMCGTVPLHACPWEPRQGIWGCEFVPLYLWHGMWHGM